MGCDIHIIAEVKVSGKWQPNKESIFPNPQPEHSWEKEQYSTEPESNRNYDWFAVLADVRNGRGFAVISEPRGVADDASPEWKKQVEDWDCDMHSHSYLTIEDFDNFDWNQLSIKQGVITLDQYKALRGTNQSPDDWCEGISGRSIITVTEDEADSMLDTDSIPADKRVHVIYQWSVMYRDWFEHKIKNVVEPLRELSNKYEGARLCFGFDN